MCAFNRFYRLMVLLIDRLRFSTIYFGRIEKKTCRQNLLFGFRFCALSISFGKYMIIFMLIHFVAFFSLFIFFSKEKQNLIFMILSRISSKNGLFIKHLIRYEDTLDGFSHEIILNKNVFNVRFLYSDKIKHKIWIADEWLNWTLVLVKNWLCCDHNSIGIF